MVRNIKRCGLRERDLEPVVKKVIYDLFDIPKLVLHEFYIRYFRPDMIFIYDKHPFVIFVELEVDARRGLW